MKVAQHDVFPGYDARPLPWYSAFFEDEDAVSTTTKIVIHVLQPSRRGQVTHLDWRWERNTTVKWDVGSPY